MPDAPPPPSKLASSAQKALHKLGLVRDIDLALHLPLRYEDETRITPIGKARQGETVQIEGEVTDCEIRLQPRRQLLVTLDDGTGTCELRFFSFYPSQQRAMTQGARLRVRGEIKGGFWGRQMLHPAWRVAEGELPKALTPVYPTAAQLPQAYLRRAIATALTRVEWPETLPPDWLPAQWGGHTWSLRDALFFLHYPTPDVALQTLQDHSHPAWQRLKAEELLAQQISQLQAKRERARLRAPQLSGKAAQDALPSQLLAALPFQLTAAQRRVSHEIARDLSASRPMHRLLQGDVGAGKTVVAALAAAVCMDAGWQCALMAPTEILAAQHFAKLIDWLQPLLAARGKHVAWLVGGQKKKERTAMLEAIASGTAALVVGTHAVIQDQVQFHQLALAVVDEQHRFGVAQRLALRKKTRETLIHSSSQAGTAVRDGLLGAKRSNSGAIASICNDTDRPNPQFPAARGMEQRFPMHLALEPHLLMMSATPIPRTLAMTYYADLDVSTLDELPPGRTPVVTRLIAEERKDEVIARIAAQVTAGRQVYWVCPLIEESEALDLSNATATHVDLSAALPGINVGLLHSRMPAAEKKAVMEAFQNGSMGVLVSTTVIEVGVDVPNASLMVIEHAERFGLSQLHQLRGRVGRGAAASACVLLYARGESGRVSETASQRLKAMLDTHDGFEIARRDLEIRGPGEFLGARQSGDALLRFADLARDAHLLDWARETAPRMLDEHPDLAALHVQRWLGGKADYLKA